MLTCIGCRWLLGGASQVCIHYSGLPRPCRTANYRRPAWCPAELVAAMRERWACLADEEGVDVRLRRVARREAL